MVMNEESVLLFPSLQLHQVLTIPKINELVAYLAMKPVMMDTFFGTVITVIPLCPMFAAMQDEGLGISVFFQIMQVAINRGLVKGKMLSHGCCRNRF
jgi:hypothetical protein